MSGPHSSSPGHVNRLARETSPYLRQHAHNPVDWYPWGAEALGRARAEDRPILLSIGYSACHWCHVMAHESFEDEGTAALMNAHFVCVKVDREERPDLDEIYMSAVQLLTGRGGWPMTVFLTPDERPFFGGTYFPPHDRHGLPSFRTVLCGIRDAWATRRDELVASAASLVGEIQKMADLGGAQGPVDAALLDRAYRDIAARFDERDGGFGGAPKFPSTMSLSFCLRRSGASGDAGALAIVTHSLGRMAAGGIHDHLGGGFHRYSVDERWLVPHFEKMLYDNALLGRLYLEGWQATGSPLLRQTAEGILDYVRRDLGRPGGGFYSSEDADSEGEEGRFYVWTREQIRAVLGDAEGELFCSAYDVTAHGNFEHGTSILNRPRPLTEVAASAKLTEDELEQRLRAARARLLEERGKRVRPGRDDKVLASWNGLMVDAFAFAARVLGSARDLASAVETGDFLWHRLRQEGRFLHSFMADEARLDAYLDDLSAQGVAFVSLWESTFDPVWLERSAVIAEALLEDFEDRDQGGFFYTSARAEPLVARTRNPYDNAIPGGNSLAVHFLQKLHALTGEERWARAAERTLAVFRDRMARVPMGLALMLEGAEAELSGIKQVAVVTAGDLAHGDELRRAAQRGYDPNRVVAVAPEGAAPALLAALFRGKRATDGRATAYLCRRFACDRPVTTAAELSVQLSGRDAGGPL